MDCWAGPVADGVVAVGGAAEVLAVAGDSMVFEDSIEMTLGVSDAGAAI